MQLRYLIPAALAYLSIAFIPTDAHAADATAAQLADASRVPVLRDVDVRYEPCPYGQQLQIAPAGCTSPGQPVVYVDVTQGDDAGALAATAYHELGHQFDRRVLGDGGDRKFAHLTRVTGTGARNTHDVHEQIADAYAACALGWQPKPGEWGDRSGHFPTGHGYDPTPRVHQLVCAMFTRAGHRAGLQ